MAFQKWQGLGRDGTAGPATMAALAGATRPTPRTTGAGNRFEVLLDRQLVLYIENGAVVRNAARLERRPWLRNTHRPLQRLSQGDQLVVRAIQVWLPWASYFVGGVAFHQSPDVPAQPASHGCVRVPRYDAKWLDDHAPVGTAVTVARELTVESARQPCSSRWRSSSLPPRRRRRPMTRVSWSSASRCLPPASRWEPFADVTSCSQRDSKSSWRARSRRSSECRGCAL